MEVLPATKGDLDNDAQRWAARVRDLNITDAESCRDASLFLRSIKGLRGQIQRWFEPHVTAAQETKRKAEEARKALVDEQARMEAPLVAAEATVKRALLAWEQSQEARRQAEEARLQAEAQREAERATLEAAAALERDAVALGDSDMLAEAESLLAQPVEAPTVFVKRDVPKVQGVSYRDNWKAHPDVDVKALAAAIGAGTAPVTFLVPNMTAINQFARATKGGQAVPGIRVINDRQVASRE